MRDPPIPVGRFVATRYSPNRCRRSHGISRATGTSGAGTHSSIPPEAIAPEGEGPPMARTVQVQLLDDIDGSKADETLTYGLDGTNYEIDLSAAHAEKLRA